MAWEKLIDCRWDSTGLLSSLALHLSIDKFILHLRQFYLTLQRYIRLPPS